MFASSSRKEKIQFLQLLQNTVDRKENSTFATWYDKHGKPQNKYTFSELWNEAGYIAHDLLANYDLSKGDRVILCYNFGLQFFAAFLGCLRAGVVAVLIYPPSPSNMAKSLEKMNKICNDSKPKLILIDSTINLLRINPLAKTRHLWPKDVIWKVHPKMPKNIKDSKSGFNNDNPQTVSSLSEYPTLPEDIAFLQYTSGSTGDPKGVMVSFQSLHANIKAIHEGAQPQLEKQGIIPDDIVGFSWLPQYHDMGLVYAVIAPFAGGWKCNMISPITFIQNPMLWIDLMSKLRVTWTVAPNFAFRLVARKFMEAKARTHREPIPNLDLRSLKYMQNSAEPIQTDTKDLFEQAFKQYGLNDDWFVGAYGLAESVVGVSYLFEYKVSTFKPNGSASLIAVGHQSSFPKGQTIKIINTDTFAEVKEREVGELWLSGPSVTSGYFGKPQLTQEVFHAKLDGDDEKKHLRTGDLAFFEDGYLYICGRLKDIVIVNGVNYYPQDIEHVVECASPGVRPGCVAAFSSDDCGGDGDLEIVFELRKSHESSANEVVTKVYDAVMKNVGIVPSKVVAIKERTICKTTSGKIQRKATRTALHSCHFEVVCIHTVHSQLKISKTAHTATSSLQKSNIDGSTREDIDNTLLETAKSMQANSLPPKLVTFIHNFSIDKTKLQLFYDEYQLGSIHKLSSAWNAFDKSDEAMQNMCKVSLHRIVTRLPHLVKVFHMLALHPEWVHTDGPALLSDILHHCFVLNFLTERISADIGILDDIFSMYTNEEREMLSDRKEVSLPPDARFFVDGRESDALFGTVTIFQYMKVRSIQMGIRKILKLGTNSFISRFDESDNDAMWLNICEVTWADYISGRHDNASTGHWLMERTSTYLQINAWQDVYVTWNMAFACKLSNPADKISKLLVPSVLCAKPERFLVNRMISLYLVLSKHIRNHLQGRIDGMTSNSLFSSEVPLLLGAMNKTFAFNIHNNKMKDWDERSTKPPPPKTLEWFRRFDKWRSSSPTVTYLPDNTLLETAKSMQANSLPPKLVTFIHNFSIDKTKLQLFYDEYQLGSIHKLSSAWNAFDKSDEAMQNMCKVSLHRIVTRLPHLVKVFHMLALHPEWVHTDGPALLSDILHHCFVLNFLTERISADIGILDDIFSMYTNEEREMLSDRKEVSLPPDARFFVDGRESDALFGTVTIFQYMKVRSIQMGIRKILKLATMNGQSKLSKSEDFFDIFWLNISEATWADYISGRHDNASTGHWLMERTQSMLGNQSSWQDVYVTWNMAFVSTFSYPSDKISKLLVPSVLCAKPEEFPLMRSISLYLVMCKHIRNHLQGRIDGMTSNSLFSSEVPLLFGALNRTFALNVNYDKERDWVELSTKSPPPKTLEWFRRFDKWLTVSNNHIMPTNSDDSKANSSSLKNNANDVFDQIIYSYFGTNAKFDKTWDELGMSSMVSVQLRDSISDAFPVTLPPDVFEQHPSPAKLKAFIKGSKGTPIIAKLSDIPHIKSTTTSWFVLGVLQLISGLILLLSFTSAIVPAFYIGKLLTQLNIVVQIPAISSSSTINWIWIPLVVPAWMLSFSICVIAMKWTLIGKYKQGKLQVQSLAYVQWWLVDRAVALWEAWIGKFFLDTPVLNIFYIVMGAKINMAAALNAFIREFDLVTIEGFSSISHPINCRKFGTWTEEEGPSMRFRSVLISNACEIKGMVSPGSTIGDGSYVDSLSVIPEGGQVPEMSNVVGNPAFVAGKSIPYENEINQSALGILKVLWLVFELYLFFATVLLGQYLWVPYLPQWRYSSLLMWCLLIVWFAYASIVTSVFLKWILIGKQKPGKIRQTLRRKICHWTADWHFLQTLELIQLTAFGGPIWNLILKLHGMDIDFATRLTTPELILPSKVDLVRIRESFMSTTLFDIDSNNHMHKIVIEKSSIGYGCKLVATEGNLRIQKASVSPYSIVTYDIDSNDDRYLSIGTCQMLWINSRFFLQYNVVVLGGIFCSLIPSYEIWNQCFESRSILLAIPLLALVMVVQVTTLAIILRSLQQFALGTSGKSSIASHTSLYLSCLRLSHFIKLVPVPVLTFRGSFVHNLLLELLGVHFKGRAIIMEQAIFEFKNITVSPDTIIDCAHISGHFALFGRFTLGHSTVSGIVNQGTYVSCGTISGPETDPWRSYIGAQIPRAIGKTNNAMNTTTRDNSSCLDKKDLRGDNLPDSFDIESPKMIRNTSDIFETNPSQDK